MYENRPTPNTVITAARMAELFTVASRSPMAATKTQAKVPGAMPP
jgi:hypothetical protein